MSGLWARFKGLAGSSSRQHVHRKIPILGVEGAGKSSLILTLGQYISLHQLGRVSIESSQVFGEYVSHVAAGRVLPPTMRHDRVSLELERIPEGAGFLDVDLTLTTEDLPGQDFRALVDEMHRGPAPIPGRRTVSLLSEFTELLSACDGFIFVVDLIRSQTPEEFALDPHRNVWRACADQVEPIMSALLLAVRMNARLEGKPIFFLFGKRDLHRLTPEQVADDFDRAMAIPLAQLRGKLMNVRQYHVQSAGWQFDSALNDLGVELLLSDLAHAVGAVRRAERP
jgi:hypothetical protein